MIATSVVTGAVGGDGIVSTLLSGLGALIGWAIQAWIVYLLGSRVFRQAATRADWGEVARTIGFAQTPKLLLVLAVVPGLETVVPLAVGAWVIAATVVAIRASLDLDLRNAVLTAVASALLPFLLLFLLAALAS